MLLGPVVPALSGVKLARAALAAPAPVVGALGRESHSLGGFVQSLDQWPAQSGGLGRKYNSDKC